MRNEGRKTHHQEGKQAAGGTSGAEAEAVAVASSSAAAAAARQAAVKSIEFRV